MPPNPVEQALVSFFRNRHDAAPSSSKVLVAFSGGPDSTALLAGLARVAPRLGLELEAAHLDHGLDPDSRRRAREAVRLAREIGVEVTTERLVPAPRSDDGPEAAARRVRYAFLERRAEQIEARYIATAHHADDQAETVLLRLAFGSGIEGLRGIAPRRGRLVRPLLSLRRRSLVESLKKTGLRALVDPTNDNLTLPRNRFRQLMIPRLEREAPAIVGDLGRLAAAAAAAAARIDRLLAAQLDPRPVPHEPGVEVDRAAFEALPDALVAHALALLHRRAGVAYPAPSEARRELVRQLRAARGGRVGCDCGRGWRWEAASGTFQLVRAESSKSDFAYTVEAPGEVEIPELGLRFRLRRGRIAPWMFTTRPDRTGLADFPRGGARCERPRIEIRNRRPGDRMRPLGGVGRRRLKDLLIDRRVPRRQRDRLPLLVIDGEIAWVPGVAVAERYRLETPRCGESGEAWIAEIDRLGSQGRDCHRPGNERNGESVAP